MMSPAEAARRERLLTAMQRFNEIGVLLPTLDDFEQALANDESGVLSTVEVLLAEMETIKAEVEAVIDEQQRAAG
jgi:hypothetical protein